MVDQAGEEQIGLKDFKEKPKVQVNYSPLKNENPDSSIIKEVKSIFPLQADFNFS